eukprot:gene20412-22425_t
MGRKRYHCEFCNRAFADTLPTRKRHLSSIQHQRLRKLHYDSFKDPSTLLAEESEKIPCKKFFQTGQCAFGDNCKFSHINTHLYKLQLGAAKSSQGAARQATPDIDSWVSKWRQQHPEKDKQSSSEKYWLPPDFPPVHQLPPSLCPPLDGGNNTNNAEWGK